VIEAPASALFPIVVTNPPAGGPETVSVVPSTLMNGVERVIVLATRRELLAVALLKYISALELTS
jgi:hypothetical protein